MPQGCHAANRKAGDRAHLLGIGAAKRLTRQGRGFAAINLIAARGQKQEQLPRRAGKQDRLHDLVQMTARRLRRLFGGAGFTRHL